MKMKLLWSSNIRIIVAVPVIISSLTIASGFLTLYLSRRMIAHAGIEEKASDVMYVAIWIMSLVAVSAISGILLGTGIVRPINKLMEEAKSKLDSQNLKELPDLSDLYELNRLNQVFRQTLMSLDRYITDSYVLNQLPEGVVSINNEGGIVNLNPLAADMFGYKTDEMVGKQYSEVLSDPPEGGLCRMIKESLEQNRSFYGQRAAAKGKKDANLTTDLHLIPEKEGLTSRLLVILRDEKGKAS